MPWTNPETFTAGQTLTAASMNIVSGNARMGGPVFTNEAARDAAITAPEEGMTVYLTAPTVPAATGAITAVPTGVRTIYNGSVWVCVTTIGASSQTSGTTSSNPHVTTLTGDSTAVSATLVTGTTVFLTMYAQGGNNGAGGITEFQMTYSVSGATTVAASETNGCRHTITGGNQGLEVSMHRMVTGLTAGANTFTLNYRAPGGIATYNQRYLTVQGVA